LLASGKISVPIVGEGETSQVVQSKVEVAPIEIGTNIVLNSISFASNSDHLNPGSLLELDRVGQFMELNPSVSIEVSAHSDDVGAADFNKQLSQRRAVSVEDYLEKKNIATNRMQSVGYGEEVPMVANDSEENRAINRRVELKVIAIN